MVFSGRLQGAGQILGLARQHGQLLGVSFRPVADEYLRSF